MTRAPAFVDCYGDLTARFTDEMRAVVPGLDVYFDEPADEDVLIERLQGRRNVLVYMGYMSARVLQSCPDLKSIAYLSTGLATHGDLEKAERLGIRFEGVKGYGDRAVAEHAIALAMAAIKRIVEMDGAVRSGNWRLMRAEEIQGSTIGIIGLGGIGRETARLAHALGARTIGWSRSGAADGAPIEMMSLEDVLAHSDIVSLHLALTPETEGFINAQALARMKPGAILINTARAGIVEEGALMAALETGRIGHCALDVFHEEPLPQNHRLAEMTNVTLTPHSGWLTTQAIDRLLLAGIELLKKHIEETRV